MPKNAHAPLQPKGPFKINRNALRLADESHILAAARAYVEAGITVQPDKMTYALIDRKAFLVVPELGLAKAVIHSF